MHSRCVSCVSPPVSQSVSPWDSNLAETKGRALQGRQAGVTTSHVTDRKPRGRRNFGVNSRVTRALDSISRGYVNRIRSEKVRERERKRDGDREREREHTRKTARPKSTSDENSHPICGHVVFVAVQLPNYYRLEKKLLYRRHTDVY